MPYPTLQQYNEALQHPEIALIDPFLKHGHVKKTGLGLPLALCGGFALTYTISNGSTRYAVRCFQKESTDLERRYQAISEKLGRINSPYFVKFAFQPQGVRVNGNNYPIVKMDWANGKTLGEYLENNYQNETALSALVNSLQKLSSYLESQKIAHGDIQPGNVMVSSNGSLKLQLIDYDGMYIESINHLGSSELGLRNFQHPQRNKHYWDHTLDRFSFIALILALRALQVNPILWKKSQSDSETILFSASDYEKPESSAIFAELRNIPQLSDYANNFALICKSSIKQIPTVADFLAKQNIPRATITFTSTVSFGEASYVSSLPILNASNYHGCLQFTGQRIELIGKITGIKSGRTRYGSPYIFINFGDWRGEVVKLAIWSDGLSNLINTPDNSWINKWVSVMGLLDPPYTNIRIGYTHQSITITQSNQIRFISEIEAGRRLSGRQAQPITQIRQTTNAEVLERARNATQLPNTQVQTVATRTTVRSNNQQFVQNIRNIQQTPQTQSNVRSTSISSQQPRPTISGTSSSSQQSRPTFTGHNYPSQNSRPTFNDTNKASQNPRPTIIGTTNASKKNDTYVNDFCFIATALYGQDSRKTMLLRNYRDQNLSNHWFGRIFVRVYYKISPYWVLFMKSNKFAQMQTLHFVNLVVDLIDKKKKSKYRRK